MSFPIAAGESANHRSALRVSAGRLCISAVALFAVLVAVLHFIEPEFGPTWRFVSEYSNGSFGWVMKLAFFVLAFGCAAAVATLRPHAQTRPARIGLFFLAVTVIGLVFGGIVQPGSDYLGRSHRQREASRGCHDGRHSGLYARVAASRGEPRAAMDLCSRASAGRVAVSMDRVRVDARLRGPRDAHRGRLRTDGLGGSP